MPVCSAAGWRSNRFRLCGTAAEAARSGGATARGRLAGVVGRVEHQAWRPHPLHLHLHLHLRLLKRAKAPVSRVKSPSQNCARRRLSGEFGLPWRGELDLLIGWPKLHLQASPLSESFPCLNLAAQPELRLIHGGHRSFRDNACMAQLKKLTCIHFLSSAHCDAAWWSARAARPPAALVVDQWLAGADQRARDADWIAPR